MTKLRGPVTFEKALTRVAGLIGWEESARIVGRTVRQVRNWSDPDAASQISIADAQRLDAAFGESGGDGHPFLDTYALRLQADVARVEFSRDALRSSAAAAAIESGQALAALITATSPTATPADFVIAEREVEEACQALGVSLIKLRKRPAGGRPQPPAEDRHLSPYPASSAGGPEVPPSVRSAGPGP